VIVHSHHDYRMIRTGRFVACKIRGDEPDPIEIFWFSRRRAAGFHPLSDSLPAWS